jgi:hypothetical protein
MACGDVPLGGDGSRGGTEGPCAAGGGAGGAEGGPKACASCLLGGPGAAS